MSIHSLSAHTEALLFLYLCSPVWCGDFPSKQARDELSDLGYAINIPVRGVRGFWTLTNAGLKSLEDMYGENLPAKVEEFKIYLENRKQVNEESQNVR